MEAPNKFFASTKDGHETRHTATTNTKTATDKEIENKLRPQFLVDYVGQTKIKSNIEIYITAAKKRGEPLDHVLLYGPAGLGKTTLSNIIANEMGSKIKITAGPVLSRAADLAGILTNLSAGDVLFIDEIHRLPATVEEVLYGAMEDFTIDFVAGKGAGANNIRLPLKPFTLIGATTKAGSVSSPLRDRFGVLSRLELYSIEELSQIITRSAKILGAEITKEAVFETAKCSRGTPRIANRLLKRVRDYAEVENAKAIDLQIAVKAMKQMDIDVLGLDPMDRRILGCMIEHFGGGPVGLENIASVVGEDSGTIEEVYEPYLIRLGFITRTPKGRVALSGAYKHLGIKLDKTKQELLNEYETK
ncbi:MAG: Holliday junction branch migration DNA helicase RuvB [Christensenellaceae bacterium]|jgi:Holliday junction DNA helicase RuvB|nr:Holliday junction branch migration DNA helicase RuvB [Christensenellaceae bacterium]